MLKSRSKTRIRLVLGGALDRARVYGLLPGRSKRIGVGQKREGLFSCHLRQVESSGSSPGRAGSSSIRRLAALQERCVSRHLCGSEETRSDNGLNCSRRSGAGVLSKPWRRNLMLHVADSGMKVNKAAFASRTATGGYLRSSR